MANTRSECIHEVKSQGISKKIVVFQAVLVFHEHRAELYHSDKITEDLGRIQKRKVTGLLMRISGDDYDKSQDMSMIIKFYVD